MEIMSSIIFLNVLFSFCAFFNYFPDSFGVIFVVILGVIVSHTNKVKAFEVSELKVEGTLL